MLNKIILVLICLPALAIFNESETFVPNIFGFIYIAVLFAARNTPVWKKLTK